MTKYSDGSVYDHTKEPYSSTKIIDTTTESSTPHVEIDITGTQVKPIPNWQERVEELCNPVNFGCEIWYIDYNLLSTNEQNRLQRKLWLVQRYARIMAAGMLKGVLKYPTDEYALEQWFAHLVGEGADKSNYDILALDAFERSR